MKSTLALLKQLYRLKQKYNGVHLSDFGCIFTLEEFRSRKNSAFRVSVLEEVRLEEFWLRGRSARKVSVEEKFG